MPRRFFGILTAVLTTTMTVGCDSEISLLEMRKLPIINGTQVTGNHHLSTVGLVQQLNPDDYHVLCTGTLIAPDYVLTAAHCIANCDDGSEPIEPLRPKLRIGIGQTTVTYRYVSEIESFHVHPEFYCVGENIRNDIAILKLADPVPESVAKPATVVSKSLDITAEMVDSEPGIMATRIGYGRTIANDPLSQGLKFKIDNRIDARCPLDGSNSKKCNQKYTSGKGFLYFEVSEQGTCQGDSGGPVFWNHAGLEIVIGVTSYGYENCAFMDAATNVTDYEDFVSQFVPVLTEFPVEHCDNQIDDDGDGRTDCDDDDCKEAQNCHDAPVVDEKQEICDNQIDDDGDGRTDCDDDDCKNNASCIDADDTENGAEDESNSTEISHQGGGCNIQKPEPNLLPLIFPLILWFRRRNKAISSDK